MEKLARLFSKGKIDAERYEELRMELQDIFNVSKYDYASDSRETKKLRQEMEERGLNSMEQIDELTIQSIEQDKKRRDARSAYDRKRKEMGLPRNRIPRKYREEVSNDLANNS